MDRYFIVGGMIQFPIGGGKALIPLQEVTPGASGNLIACEPDETVLAAVRDDAAKATGAPWGNDEVMIVGQAWLNLTNPRDTCHLLTVEAWAAQKIEGGATIPTTPSDNELIAAAQAIAH